MRAFPEIPTIEEERLKAESRLLCKTDLHYLAKEVLGYNRLTDHYHARMAQDIDTPNYKFKLLLHPRGHFKSTIGTEARSVKKLLVNPDERILLTNVKLANSRKFLRAIAHHFEANPRLRWLWREWWIRQYATPFHKADMGDRLDWIVKNTQDEFTLLRPNEGREASITTGALDASMVSQHYSTILADDLVNREYVRTVEGVERSILYFKDLLDLLDPGGELCLIGTRWAHMDLYGWIIEEFGGVASLVVPKGYVKEEVVAASEKCPDKDKRWLISIQPCYGDDGEPVFPEEFTKDVLTELERVKGPYEFGAQYNLNPTSKEGQKFKDEWFQYLDVMPDPKHLSVCITVDPAKSLLDNADMSAIVAYGYDKSNYMYLLDGINERLTVDELPEALFQFVRKWHGLAKFVYPVGFESVGFQETYIHVLQRMMLERNFFFGIEPIARRVQSKEERILRLVPRVKNGFYIPRRLMIQPFSDREPPYDLTQRLLWELIHFPLAGRDDLADATADQLEIVIPSKLPDNRPNMSLPNTKPDFIHPSILSDRQHSLRRIRAKQRQQASVR